MFKEIVLAVTPSKRSEAAVEAAIGLARKHNAGLVITYVYSPLFSEFHFKERSESILKKTGRIKEELQRRYARKTNDLSQCSYFVVQGDPATEILRISRMVRSDLIVMGPHPLKYEKKRTRLKKFKTAEKKVSTMERVSQLAECPVMVVSHKISEDQLDYGHIIVATDFSQYAEHALHYAAHLAGRYKAKLLLLNVLDTDSQEQALSGAEIRKRIKLAEEKIEQELLPQLKDVKKVSYECRPGRPFEEILKLAGECRADLVVMAHHSREQDPESAVLGSTVAKVALDSKCPTISINKDFDLPG